jgi:hypothetical protein
MSLREQKTAEQKWWEPLERMEYKRIRKIISKQNSACERHPGKPQKRWKDDFLINQTLTIMSYSII